MPTCYRHPTRETGVSCSNCGRPICPDCMTSTTVGMRCPECARQRTRVVRPRAMVDAAPRATEALIAINVAVFLAEVATGHGGLNSAGGTVYAHGGLAAPLISPVHEYWRLITSGFLHGGAIHLLLNMVFLWFVGRSLEPAIGTARFVVAYLAALLCGSLGVVLLEPNTFAVGASGALYGLLGTLMVEARRRGISLWDTGLIQVALINFAFTFAVPGIAFGAHLFGFAGGILVGVIYDQFDRRRLPRTASLAAGAALAAAAFVGAIAVA